MNRNLICDRYSDQFATILGEIIKDMDTPAGANRGLLDYWMGETQ